MNALAVVFLAFAVTYSQSSAIWGHGAATLVGPGNPGATLKGPAAEAALIGPDGSHIVAAVDAGALVAAPIPGGVVSAAVRPGIVAAAAPGYIGVPLGGAVYAAPAALGGVYAPGLGLGLGHGVIRHGW